MSRGERPDIPNWMLSAGEKIQSFDDKLPLSALIRWVAGSDSPSYIQARWHTADQVINTITDKSTTLLTAEADPEASLLTLVPRFKRKAAVINSPWTGIDELMEEHDAEPAVAYSYKGKTHAGTLPNGKKDLATSAVYYSAAMRTGRNDFGVGLGVWLPGDRVFLRSMYDLVEQNVPIAELNPRIPLL